MGMDEITFGQLLAVNWMLVTIVIAALLVLAVTLLVRRRRRFRRMPTTIDGVRIETQGAVVDEDLVIERNWRITLLMNNVTRKPAPVPALSSRAVVTAGRLFFARFAHIFPPRLLLVGLPGLLAVVFLGISRLSPGETTAGLALFALAGLGCSALLPLIISFGEQQLPQLGQSAAGILIALYQLGYGLAAFGGGALQESFHLPMQSLFGWGALLALLQALISFPISVGARGRLRA